MRSPPSSERGSKLSELRSQRSVSPQVTHCTRTPLHNNAVLQMRPAWNGQVAGKRWGHQ